MIDKGFRLMIDKGFLAILSQEVKRTEFLTKLSQAHAPRTHSRDASSLACLVETLIVGGGKGWAPAFDSRVCPGRTVALHITVLLHSGVLSPSQSLGTPALLTQLWLATRPLHSFFHSPISLPTVLGSSLECVGFLVQPAV